MQKSADECAGRRYPKTDQQFFFPTGYFVAPGVGDTQHTQVARSGQCPSGPSPPRAGSNGRNCGVVVVVVYHLAHIHVTFLVGVPSLDSDMFRKALCLAGLLSQNYSGFPNTKQSV